MRPGGQCHEPGGDAPPTAFAVGFGRIRVSEKFSFGAEFSGIMPMRLAGSVLSVRGVPPEVLPSFFLGLFPRRALCKPEG